MKSFRTLISLLILAFTTSVFAQEVVNIYSARHYDSDETLFTLFTEQTGIEVNKIESGASELIERIRSEGENTPADVLITVDASNLWRADQADLFQPSSSEVLEAAIPVNLRHPSGHWFGLATRARAIVYNKEFVNPSELSTYEDLASDTWANRICIRSSSNIYNQSLLSSIIAANGAEAAESWAEAVVNNMARSPQGGDTDQIRAVAAGECDIAVVNHYYLARLIASADSSDNEVADAVGIFFPNQDDRGTHINISGAGVVAGAPNAENAIAFIEFLASPEAQQIFADQNNEYPVIEGLMPSMQTQSFGDFDIDELSVDQYGENNPEAVRIFDRVGWQ